MATPNSASQIDSLVLSVVDGRWKKVAMVIAIVERSMGADLLRGDDGLELIARQIEALVQDGRLLAQGDVTNWRCSEVRRGT